MKPTNNERIELGYIGGAHGLHGEVLFRPHNLDTTLPTLEMDVVVVDPKGGRRTLRVTARRKAGKGVLLGFQGVVDRTGAEALCGRTIEVARDLLPPLEDGEFYYEDVVGLPVRDVGGAEVGRVDAVFQAATDILIVKRPGGELLVPVVEGFVIEVRDDVVVIDLAAVEAE